MKQGWWRDILKTIHQTRMGWDMLSRQFNKKGWIGDMLWEQFPIQGWWRDIVWGQFTKHGWWTELHWGQNSPNKADEEKCFADNSPNKYYDETFFEDKSTRKEELVICFTKEGLWDKIIHTSHWGMPTVQISLALFHYLSQSFIIPSKYSLWHPVSLQWGWMQIFAGQPTLGCPKVKSHVKTSYEFVLTLPAVSRLSYTSYLNGLWDGRSVLIQLLFFRVLVCFKPHTAFLCSSDLTFSPAVSLIPRDASLSLPNVACVDLAFEKVELSKNQYLLLKSECQKKKGWKILKVFLVKIKICIREKRI